VNEELPKDLARPHRDGAGDIAGIIVGAVLIIMLIAMLIWVAVS
jgi:membrane protein involved in colicin uptake